MFLLLRSQVIEQKSRLDAALLQLDGQNLFGNHPNNLDIFLLR
jgi:hypothetical protein